MDASCHAWHTTFLDEFTPHFDDLELYISCSFWTIFHYRVDGKFLDENGNFRIECGLMMFAAYFGVTEYIAIFWNTLAMHGIWGGNGEKWRNMEENERNWGILRKSWKLRRIGEKQGKSKNSEEFVRNEKKNKKRKKKAKKVKREKNAKNMKKCEDMRSKRVLGSS